MPTKKNEARPDEELETGTGIQTTKSEDDIVELKRQNENLRGTLGELTERVEKMSKRVMPQASSDIRDGDSSVAFDPEKQLVITGWARKAGTGCFWDEEKGTTVDTQKWAVEYEDGTKSPMMGYSQFNALVTMNRVPCAVPGYIRITRTNDGHNNRMPAYKPNTDDLIKVRLGQKVGGEIVYDGREVEVRVYALMGALG